MTSLTESNMVRERQRSNIFYRFVKLKINQLLTISALLTLHFKAKTSCKFLVSILI